MTTATPATESVSFYTAGEVTVYIKNLYHTSTRKLLNVSEAEHVQVELISFQANCCFCAAQ